MGLSVSCATVYNQDMGTENDFSKYLVKDYKYWAVYVHENQGYLGRCIVWCKRADALDLTEVTSDEQQELFLVLKKIRQALIRCFHADWFNYAFLGNGVRHLHSHVIPRYAKPVHFMGMVFEDKQYGHNYKTDHDFITPEVLLQGVRSQLAKALN